MPARLTHKADPSPGWDLPGAKSLSGAGDPNCCGDDQVIWGPPGLHLGPNKCLQGQEELTVVTFHFKPN